MPRTRAAPYRRFLERLRLARKEAGLDQVEVARLLGKPQSYVSKCETGERRIDVIELLAFARIYGMRLDDFVRADDLSTRMPGARPPRSRRPRGQ